MTKFYVDGAGNYLGGFDGATPPNGSVEVANPPSHARQRWNGSAWGPAPAPDRITARQFKLQLEIDGLTSTVEGWVAQQTRLVQIAYANSGTFVRTEPMMVAGFSALGFTEAEGDAFFTAAAAL